MPAVQLWQPCVAVVDPAADTYLPTLQFSHATHAVPVLEAWYFPESHASQVLSDVAVQDPVSSKPAEHVVLHAWQFAPVYELVSW